MGFEMSRYSTFVTPIMLALLAVAAPCSARQPNIILIMADDLGYETITANGGESYQTPNLDKLAAGGVRFEECYVQPLCTPTRVQLMTGQSNVRNYIEFGVLDPEAKTFAHVLKEAGYATGIAGKWQLGRKPGLPQRFGFDESCLWQQTRRPPRYANPGLEYNGEERDFTNGEYGPDLVNDFAIDFVTRHKEQPFLLYHPMLLTHGPYVPTPDSADWNPEAKSEEEDHAPQHFGEMVAYMDKLVGKLTAKLDELGIREETIIIFLGDNGTGAGTVSQFRGKPFVGGKGTTTARGMHVPLIVNWPGHVPAGEANDDLISSVDFLPTLCAAAGVAPPESMTLDGKSFWPQALGQEGSPRTWLYSWYSQDGGEQRKREFAMTKEYKLYRDGQLFDLKADPLEAGKAIDRAAWNDRQQEVAKELGAVLASYANARPAALIKPGAPATKAHRQQAARRKDAAAKVE